MTTEQARLLAEARRQHDELGNDGLCTSRRYLRKTARECLERGWLDWEPGVRDDESLTAALVWSITPAGRAALEEWKGSTCQR